MVLFITKLINFWPTLNFYYILCLVWTFLAILFCWDLIFDLIFSLTKQIGQGFQKKLNDLSNSLPNYYIHYNAHQFPHVCSQFIIRHTFHCFLGANFPIVPIRNKNNVLFFKSVLKSWIFDLKNTTLTLISAIILISILKNVLRQIVETLGGLDMGIGKKVRLLVYIW